MRLITERKQVKSVIQEKHLLNTKCHLNLPRGGCHGFVHDYPIFIHGDNSKSVLLGTRLHVFCCVRKPCIARESKHKCIFINDGF